MKIVFFGTPEFAKEILQFLRQRHTLVGIVTREDKPKGRGLHLEPSPVKKAAGDIPILNSKEEIQALQPDLFVVVAYGKILKQDLLAIPGKGAINVHTSLLPKYRGAAPIQRAIMQGEGITGVTIQQMALELDAGDILKQVACEIPSDMTFGELQDQLCHLGKEALEEVLQQYDSLPRIPQNHSEATFAPKVELEECEVDFEKEANVLHNLVRGVNPVPGAWCFITLRGERKKLKIFKTKVVKKEGQPGQILSYGKVGFVVACKKDALQLIDIQLEGKKRMPAEAFCCGFLQSDLILTRS